MEHRLEILDQSTPIDFSSPTKKIHDGPDVEFFLTSTAYRDIMTFTLQLNRAMVPRKLEDGKVRTFELGSDNVQFSQLVGKLGSMISKLESIIEEAPPDTGPRRFGNISFRTWYKLVEDRADGILSEFVPLQVLGFKSSTITDGALYELRSYLLGSFGSPQRLDYGTGHELSFLAFLGGIWKLGGFENQDPDNEERGIVLGIFEPYLHLIRNLIRTYTLEPAGSHGVWGLDDNSFLPYIFGSAQFSPAINSNEQTPVEGSLPDTPDPSSVAKSNIVEQERKRNMYFSAVGNIYDVKRGPFWEHSPMLYDISGIRAGWGKINKGMIKMYNAEVLSKYPVVQHFPFGSLFRWEKDPEATALPASTHTTSQPLRTPVDNSAPITVRPAGPSVPSPSDTRQIPVGMVDGVTRAPWASQTRPPPPPTTRFIPMTRPQSGVGQRPPPPKPPMRGRPVEPEKREDI